MKPDIRETDTLREAREKLFQAFGFSEAGYKDRWVPIQLGPLRFSMPNSPGRAAAVHWHDLHHVLTGYPADWLGEAEIGAWEIASGCRQIPAAFAYNALAVFSGTWLGPGRVLRAFARGLRSRNLYGRGIDEAFLGRRVGDVRKELSLSPERKCSYRGTGARAER